MIAYSSLDLKPWEFWDNMNPRDFLKMCEGFNLRRRREQREWLEQMKVIRWVGSMIYNTSRGKKSQLLKPEKLYGLPELESEQDEAESKKNIIPDRELLKEIDTWTPPRKLNDKTLEEVIQEQKKQVSGKK